MKVETKVRRHEDVCPICRHELVPLVYLGKRRFVLNRYSSEYRRDTFEDLVEDGRIVWAEGVEPRWHRGYVSGEPVNCGIVDVSSG